MAAGATAAAVMSGGAFEQSASGLYVPKKPALAAPAIIKGITDPSDALLTFPMTMWSSAAGGTGVQETSSATDGTVAFGVSAHAFGDRSWTVDNGATVFRWGHYNASGGARTVVAKIYLHVSGTSVVDVVVTETFSHTGSGWEWFTLSSPFVVPGSGTYWAGVFCANWGTTSKTTALNIERLGTADPTGTGVTFTNQNRETPMVGVEY